ncbi:MAG: Hsp20/alpha crystallin family protein [Desulfobacterales bacterium]|jgi:HSP20 family protein|nr:Hsp20/alpha crystallin family protein [Desulfobacterales bacterium]
MFPKRFIDFPDWNVGNPFLDFERMRREMNRLSEGFRSGLPSFSNAGVFPLTNVSEDINNYYVRAELPGMNTEDIEISATDSSLSISGQRIIPREGDNVRYHRREREAGKFSRMISLPGSVDTDKVEASFMDGILTIVLPKSEAMKPKQIEVK